MAHEIYMVQIFCKAVYCIKKRLNGEQAHNSQHTNNHLSAKHASFVQGECSLRWIKYKKNSVKLCQPLFFNLHKDEDITWARGNSLKSE